MARPGRVTLPATVHRAAVPDVVRRCLRGSGAGSAPVACDAAAVVEPRLPAVEVIARVALAVRRDRRMFRLEHAGPELIALLDLCGLRDALGLPDETAGPP